MLQLELGRGRGRGSACVMSALVEECRGRAAAKLQLKAAERKRCTCCGCYKNAVREWGTGVTKMQCGNECYKNAMDKRDKEQEAPAASAAAS